MDNAQAQLFEALEQFRLERDLTYRELSIRLGLSESTVIRMISRGSGGLKRTRFKVCRFLQSEGVDVKPTAVA